MVSSAGKEKYKEYKYLYLTDLNELNEVDLFNKGICVEKCPT